MVQEEIWCHDLNAAATSAIEPLVRDRCGCGREALAAVVARAARREGGLLRRGAALALKGGRARGKAWRARRWGSARLLGG